MTKFTLLMALKKITLYPVSVKFGTVIRSAYHIQFTTYTFNNSVIPYHQPLTIYCLKGEKVSQKSLNDNNENRATQASHILNL